MFQPAYAHVKSPLEKFMATSPPPPRSSLVGEGRIGSPGPPHPLSSAVYVWSGLWGTQSGTHQPSLPIPLPCGQTNTSENITFSRTVYVVVNNYFTNGWPHFCYNLWHIFLWIFLQGCVFTKNRTRWLCYCLQFSISCCSFQSAQILSNSNLLELRERSHYQLQKKQKLSFTMDIFRLGLLIGNVCSTSIKPNLNLRD